MTANQFVRDALRRALPLDIKRALAKGSIALCGVGMVAAYAQPAVTTQTASASATSAKVTATKTAADKTAAAKQSILLAQATTVPQPAATTAPPQLQTVVVTGTMIARPAAETAEAITVLKADALKNQGITNVEQALNTLTSNAPTVNIASAVGTFDGGGTYANLRDLGSGRTLVLLDGQRLAPNAFPSPAGFTSGDGAVDLSGIPFSALEGVEVLREGASALYGSDAIAGVINFKTRRDFQGLQVEGNFDHPQERGGGSVQGDVTFGHGDLVSDGYNLLITGSFQHQQEVQATWRSFSAEGYDAAGGTTNTNDPGTWPGTFVDSVGNDWQPDYPTCSGNPFLEIDPKDLGNTCAYRYSAATDDIPDSKETSGLASFTKALPANNTLQLQYFYTRSELRAWSGPMFYSLSIAANNPYIPAPSALICESTCTVNGQSTGAPTTTPILDGGPYKAIWTDPLNNRYNGNINTEQRALLTFSGSNGGWDYTVSGNYSQNQSNSENDSGYPNETVLAPTGAIEPVLGAPGVPGILSNLINPFGPQSAAGQALINSSYVAGTYLLGEDKRWSFDGHASHELGDAFGAGTPATVALGLNVGGEHFQSNSTFYNDISSAATGLSDSQISKGRQFQAAFLEIDLPLTKSLDLDISDREDRYSDFGRTNNGKVSVRYQPARFLTLRGTASTGFRAPTLNDLYAPNTIAASTSGTMGQGNPDCPPASGANAIAPFTNATCATQGLGVTGGNSKLTPETSQNFDFGIVLSPVRNMGITLDYYRILLKNTIGSIPPQAMYADPSAFTPYMVLATAPGYPPLTPSVDSATQCIPFTLATCGYLLLTNQNTGSITTDGVDVSIQYLQHTPIGTFREDLEGTAVTQFQDQQYNGGPSRNLVGWFNNLPPAYRWQHDLRIDWASPHGMWGGGLANRFYSSYIDEFVDGSGNPRTVGSYSLVDVYASVKPISHLTVLFGIKNILDRNPPFTNASENNFTAGYNVLTADPLMRNFYLNVRYDML